MWLGGFKSAMDGNKALALEAWAERTRHAFVRFDYMGHGKSDGDFREGTVTRWRNDALAIIDRLATGPQILVGSSMGGWLALLASRLRTDRVRGIVLIAPAADFTEALLWRRLSESARRSITETGEWLMPSRYDPQPYPITRALIEDGRKHLILEGDALHWSIPIRVLQGMNDLDVPWEHALKLVLKVHGDIRLTLVKDGDHRLSRPADLRLIEQTLECLLGELAE